MCETNQSAFRGFTPNGIYESRRVIGQLVQLHACSIPEVREFVLRGMLGFVVLGLIEDPCPGL